MHPWSRAVMAVLAVQAMQLLVDANVVISLDGTWTLTNANNSIKALGIVPGGVYSDLRTAGVLDTDIFYRFNDRLYRWVALDNWTYSRSFDVTEELMTKRYVQLVLHGVDTVADVRLNGVSLGMTDNMFVRYTFPVRNHLKPNGNKLKIHFLSPVSAARQLFEKQSQQYVVPPTCVPPEYHGECHVNHLRKMQASFGWDWGPAFPSMGIWKSVQLEGFDGAVLRSVTTTYIEEGDDGQPVVEIGAFLEAGVDSRSMGLLEGYVEATLQLLRPLVVSVPVSLTPDDKGECNTTLLLPVPQEEVSLWWPKGMGRQPMYNLSVSFTSNDDEESSILALRIAFRTLELVQTPVRKKDKSAGFRFELHVNRRPMFCKGSNWIPANILPERTADPKVVRHLLSSASAANMNMLRVWGGGIYESDLFYSTADELGILIWQDMMFACSMYPANPKFLRSVSREVEQQVKRLQHHPSVALWAGNNENEAALRGNWYGTASKFSLYKADYVKLYVSTIRPIVKRIDSRRPYLVSSPSNGLQSEAEGYIADNPYSPLYGDTHYYNYWSDGWDPSIYPQTRFGSEYGFQSLPSLETLIPVSLPEDRSVSSEFSISRQHHPAGYQVMALEANRHLPLPEFWYSHENFTAYIYMSQINQAMSTKTETEKYRRSRSLLDLSGVGLTMGALYWQLNDVWQAPSWASIDIAGRWKMLHYFARDFFSAVIVSPFVSPSGDLHVFAVSDLPKKVLLASVRVRVGRWNQLGLPQGEIIANFTLKAQSSQKVFTEGLSSFLQRMNCPVKEECFLLFNILVTMPYEVSLGPDNFLFPAPLKNAHGLTGSNITVHEVSGPIRKGFIVVLKTDRPAPFVWLETGRILGVFSENGFLMAEPVRRLVFFPSDDEYDLTAAQLKHAITVTSLRSSM